MLNLIIRGPELFDENKGIITSGVTGELQLEHSLLSISKWESKWKRAFISEKQYTPEEFLDYIKCMTINKPKDDLYDCLSEDNVEAIRDYIQDPHSATVITEHDKNKPQKKQTITAEVIYYRMIQCNIPFECQKWHFNKLMTLIRICDIYAEKPPKGNKKSQLKHYSQLNQARHNAIKPRG